jgi:hypothetical protein
MAAAPNPSIPPIPQPIAELGALTFVAQALKQRVENIAGYALTVKGATAGATTSSTPSSYVLPAATTTTLGGVIVDGVTVKMVGSVLSAATGAAPSTIVPQVDGAASIGGSFQYARADHVHPTDNSRYPASNPAQYVPKPYVDAANVALLARFWFGR